MNVRSLNLTWTWLVLMAWASFAHAQVDCNIRFTDVTQHSGIRFVHTHGGSEMGYIVEGMSTGIASFDYNGDGWIDIYFLNGAPLQGTSFDAPARNALYRNNGDFTFTDVTEPAGVGDTGYGLGVAAADYDGDGDIDLYINNFGANVLYRNNGDETFTDVTAEAGVENGSKVARELGFWISKEMETSIYMWPTT